MLLGRIENTEVYARASESGDSKTKTETKNIPKTSHLRYPYVVMSRPPSHLELEMPAEEYDKNDPFVVVEDMPRFNKSDLNGFKYYVQQAIEYPQDAIDDNISGRVYVQFVIRENGGLSDAVIIKGVHPLLDKEVLRVINNSPAWEPGKQRGQPVNLTMFMPVDFYLY